MNRIVAVVTVFSSPEMLQHFVRHYAKLGIDRLLVALACKYDYHNLASDYSGFLRVFPVPVRRFSNAYKHECEERLLREEKTKSSDWIMHLDLDEFHQYPVHVRDIVHIADSRNICAISGQLFDRVTRQGKLAQVRYDVPLDQQFPWGGWLTKNLVRGNPCKIMLAKRWVQLNNGRHGVRNGAIGRWPVGISEDYLVHHFRWTHELIQRIGVRWHSVDLTQNRWARHNTVFADEYLNKGYIDMENPVYRLQPTALKYPSRWNTIAKLGTPSGSGLSVMDLEFIPQIVHKLSIKTVLEFGIGLSTAALVGAGCRVTCLVDTHAKVKTALREYGHSLIKVCKNSWNDPYNSLKRLGPFDMTFCNYSIEEDSMQDKYVIEERFMTALSKSLMFRSQDPQWNRQLLHKLSEMGWKTQMLQCGMNEFVFCKKNDNAIIR